MTRFFWRIFLSAWVIVVITVALTFWVGSWLPDPGATADAADGPSVAEQVVALAARDMRRQLAADPSSPVDAVAREHALDLGILLQVYVLDPDGKDVLGRRLPGAVAEFADSPAASAASDPPRLHARDDGLGGYAVVAYEGFFPLGRELAAPGRRGLIIVVALVVSAAVSFLLARFVILPVRRLQLAGQKVAAGDLSVRVAHTVGSRTDEIARLARDFDVMTERVDALLQTQQRLMRDVSHELRSPLARLQALLSIARQKGGAASEEQIDRMETELGRLDELIGDILAYARLEARQGIARKPTDIVDLLQNIVDDASLEAQAAGKRIRLRSPGRCVVDVDSAMIQSAVENVVRNALKHTAQGTSVEVSIIDDAQRTRVVVDDHGPGVAPDALEKIFEPFYRVGDSRGSQSGSGGIGLAIAERSVRLHDGTVTASNREDGGLRVAIELPAGAG